MNTRFCRAFVCQLVTFVNEWYYLLIGIDSSADDMSGKMIQIGVRIPQEDAEFIASLKVEGATTPSDKVRSIIAEARRRNQGMRDYQSSLAAMHELVSPTLLRVRQLELNQRMHSELVIRVLEWLPEVLALVISGHTALVSEKDQAHLELFESDLASRVFRLIESILQLSLTRHSACYQPEGIEEHIASIVDLVRVIDKARPSEIKESKNG